MSLTPYSQRLESITLDNRYQIKSVIGQGGMGTVYEAEDLLLGCVKLAIKFLLHPVIDEKMKRSFLNEAKICAFLGNKSINIVRVMDYGVYQDDIPYYVMEYLPGQSLKALLEEAPLSMPQFLSIARQICIGLAAAHEGITIDNKVQTIVHRDIKPANIFITPDPLIKQLVKILDFGIAKFFSDHSCVTQTSTYIGTLAYSSPEQIEGTDVDARSDIYSLGVMLYEMLTKQFPWDLSSPSFGAWYKAHHYREPIPLSQRTLHFQLPGSLESLILSCLEKDPNHRPQTVGRLIEIFERLAQEMGMGVPGRNYAQEFPNIPESNIPKPKISERPEVKASVPSPEADDDFHHSSYEHACETQYFTITTGCCRSSDLQIPSSRLRPEEDLLCWHKLWPENKPIAEIVFPQLIENYDESISIPSVWVMFPPEKIKGYLNAATYNHFILSVSPYPVLLWLTAIYRHECGVKFLPCYLDLMNPFNQKMLKKLSTLGYYALLFFNQDSPHTCQSVRRVSVNDRQGKLLTKWLKNIIQQDPETFNPKFESLSKQVLKREYICIKKKVTEKFEAQQHLENPNLEIDLDDVLTFSVPSSSSQNSTDLPTSAWL